METIEITVSNYYCIKCGKKLKKIPFDNLKGCGSIFYYLCTNTECSAIWKRNQTAIIPPQVLIFEEIPSYNPLYNKLKGIMEMKKPAKVLKIK